MAETKNEQAEKLAVDFSKAEVTRKEKKRKGFGGTEQRFLEVSLDKKFFKENFPKYKELKQLSKDLKEWNEQAVTHARGLIAEEMKKDKDGKFSSVEVRVPNGVSSYDRLTVRGRKNPEGEVRLSYVDHNVSILPSKSFMAEEKEKLLEALKK